MFKQSIFIVQFQDSIHNSVTVDLFSFRIHIQRKHKIVHENISTWEYFFPQTQLNLTQGFSSTLMHLSHSCDINLIMQCFSPSQKCVWLFACKTTSKLLALVVAHNKPTILVCHHQFHKFSTIVHLTCELEPSHWSKASEWSCVITGNYCLAGCAGVKLMVRGCCEVELHHLSEVILCWVHGMRAV